MGPGSSSAYLPTRPRFSWDIKNVPWTDGKGNQEEYSLSVSLWNAFHNRLPDSNSNKIPTELRGIMLQSQLYGRAKDLCKSIPDTEIQSATGSEAVVNAVYKRDALSVVIEVYQNFISLLSTKRGTTETYKNFESRFDAQVSRFNAGSSTTKLPEALTAFMILANSAVDNGQRVSVLAAASNNTNIAPTATTDDFLDSVSYEKVASVLRQCDQVMTENIRPLSANAVNTQFKRPNFPRNRRRLTPDQLADLKSRSKCRKCHKFGHWHSDHTDDGKLKLGVKSTDNPAPSDAKSNSQPPKKTVTFNMGHLLDSHNEISEDFTGPLLDDGGPYSGLGMSEFMILQPIILPDWEGNLDPIPQQLQSCAFWQYGAGKHSSEARRILGSVTLMARTDKNNLVSIRHLIIEGSSQWIIGRNVTKHCDIVHVGDNRLVMPTSEDSIGLQDNGFHSYIPYNVFLPNSSNLSSRVTNKFYCATAQINQNQDTSPFGDIKKIVDNVHQHVCGHSSYSDIKILLQRNNIWNAEVQKYLSRVLDRFSSCLTTSQPKDTRKVSLSSMSRNFNDVVCIDHFHLDTNRVFHLMDSASRYSTGDVVRTMTMTEAINCFESLWITPFWTPKCVLFDQAFNNTEFIHYLKSQDIETRPIPPRRHNKNVIESKHRVIRDVYLRLKEGCTNDSAEHQRLLVQQALRISNDLYGNDVCSAHELAKGYTRPIISGEFPAQVPEEIAKAHDDLMAKRKLTRILHSKSTADIPFNVGDTVQVYIKEQNAKRGKWSSPKVILSFDKTSGTISVPGKRGRQVKAAVEDVRPALPVDTLGSSIQEAIDALSKSLDDCIDDLCSKEDVPSNDELETTTIEEVGYENDDGDILSSHPEVGDVIDVYWPLDDMFYTGKVASNNEDDNQYNIDYNDGDKECLKLSDETWRYSSDEAIATNNVQISDQTLKSSLQEVLGSYTLAFGHKDFMRYQAQGLPKFPLLNAYKKEEEAFKKTVKMVHASDIPKHANVITSHVIYKVKNNDDGSMKMKARIAPHGNKDKERFQLKTDSSTCPPTGIRILLSLAAQFKWFLAKIDFKSAFLQTGEAKRDVYVVPPRESDDKQHYWLLLTAAYGLVNSNAKWQEQSDNFLTSIGLRQLVYVPQLFYKKDAIGSLQLVAVKIVDDVLFAGDQSTVRSTIGKIQERYELGTIVYGPGSFLFFGLHIAQDDECSIRIQADDKLDHLNCYPIDRQRRKQGDEVLNAVETSSFRSVNSSIGWLGIAALPFCAFYASHLQQKVPQTTVHDMISQIDSLRLLQKLGSTIMYKRPADKKEYPLSVLMFSDASRSSDYGQLGFISGLLIGDFEMCSIFHTLSWCSHKSKRPVKSIGAAEILASGEAIDEGKVLVSAYKTLLDVEVDLMVALDSKDLYETLSTCRNSIDRSIRADVSVIRYEFETHKVNRIIWIPGKTNLADPLTKVNSPLVQPLQLKMFSGELSMNFTENLFRNSNQFTG